MEREVKTMTDNIILEYVKELKKLNKVIDEGVDLPSNFKTRFERSLENMEECLEIARIEEIDKRVSNPLKQLYGQMKKFARMVK
jgi:hypothetical protein